MKDNGCFIWAIIMFVWFALWGIFGVAMGQFIEGILIAIGHLSILSVYANLCEYLAKQSFKRRILVFAGFFFLFPFIAHILWIIHIYSKTDFWGLGYAQFYGIIIGCVAVLYLPILFVAITKNKKDANEERRIEEERRDKENKAKAFEKSQKEFSKYCRNKRDELAPAWGCYNYDFYQYQTSEEKFARTYYAFVWQMFNYSFCSNDRLDYSVYPMGKKNVDLLSNIIDCKQRVPNAFFETITKYFQQIKKDYPDREISLIIGDNGVEDSAKKDEINKFHFEAFVSQINALEKVQTCNDISEIKPGSIVIVVELVSENKRLQETCRQIKESCDIHGIVYFSYQKEMSTMEMQKIINQKLEERRLEEKKKEIERFEQALRNSYAEYDTRTYETCLQKAKAIETEDYTEEQKAIVKKATESFAKDYNEGFIGEQEQFFVKYTPITTLAQSPDKYSFVCFPQKDCIVFPHRRKRCARRGFSEAEFEKKLHETMPTATNFAVIGDANLVLFDNSYPYEPDIAIVEKNNKLGVRIDIEIDEPYTGIGRKPIHYIGCGDEFRDQQMTNVGWIVVRFSEKQVVQNANECIAFIQHILSQIDSTFTPTIKFTGLPSDDRWTEIVAKCHAAMNYREKMLDHTFGETSFSSFNLFQNQIEKEASAHVSELPVQTSCEKNVRKQTAAIDFPKEERANLDGSSKTFENDALLSFEPKEHLYIYHDGSLFTPVSTIIERHFPPFDALGISESIARRDHRLQEDILQEWELKGTLSRDVGTFLHAQIEAYFNHLPIEETMQFHFEGLTLKHDETISIQPEIEQFRAFLEDEKPQPFRTEWRICDVKHRIAGTIDLLCKNGDSYDIYDWKRSRRAFPDPPTYDKFGIDGLPDNSFHHYALQQNLYKYILENNYNIKVGKMAIVVLHADFGTYQKFDIPDLQSTVHKIVSRLS